MATQDTTLTYSASLSLDQTAWDRVAYYELREALLFDRFATEGPTQQSMPGSTVKFRFVNDLSVATTALDERTDVDAVIPSSTDLTVTLAEYGNVVKTTAFHRANAYIPLDPIVANLIGWNAGESQDTLAANELHGGTNVLYGGDATTRGGAGTGLVAADKITTDLIRKAVAQLRGASVRPLMNSHYVATIHPDVSFDLRDETDNAAWFDPHAYSQPGEIWDGEIGVYAGVKFIESARAGLVANAGDGGTVDVYQTLVLGKECLAKAFPVAGGFGPHPHVVPGPVTDHLRRFVPMGWYWVGKYKRFREAAIRRIETSSSIGAN